MSGSRVPSGRGAPRPPLAPPLARFDLDRDYLSRAGGVEGLLADPAARLVVLHDGRALGASRDALALVPAARVGEVDPDAVVFLGRARSDAPDLAAGAPVLALDAGDELAATLDGEWLELRGVGARLGARDAGIFAQALALANWHAASGFSPGTGTVTRVGQSGWVRIDPDTGREHYPRTDPAVIVAVLDDEDRILLGSNVEWGAGRFSLLAGFVEPGESLEAAVVREIFEEAGVVVADPVYLGSQPWPFPASLMLGFEARIAAGTPSEPTPDGTELRELRWFTREQLAADAEAGRVTLPRSASIARAIIEDWYGGALPDGAEG
ncbi:NAD(+) diphosphatase [Protaetiibacter intestinalis]|nr:NAD(+) diphosphatase [Protaetiibacter intestinalis]